MSKFERDLEKGIRCEEGMLKILKEKYPTIKRSKGYNIYFDLYDDDYNTWEVKADLGSRKTKNIAIERECKGNLSGIEKTRAKYWVHIFKYKGRWVYTICETEELKIFLRGSNLKTVEGGDNDDSKVYLVEKEYFLRVMNLVPNII